MSLSPPRTKSSLLALPTEIRTIILTTLLRRLRPVDLWGCEINKLPKVQGASAGIQTTPNFVFLASSQRLSSQILRVCAQIYEEGSRLLYIQNEFDLQEDDAIVMERTEVMAKNLALIRRMRITLRTLLFLKHNLEAFPALQRVDITDGAFYGQTAGRLNTSYVSLREVARLRIRKPNIRNALAVLCAEHPRSQMIFTFYPFFDYEEMQMRIVRWPAW
jgi:hypothetical protein